MVKRILKSFKNTVRSPSAGELCISVLHCIESAVLPRLIDDKKAVNSYYRSKSGKTSDLAHPTRFSEKLNRYKLTDRNPLMPLCADKVEVRQYVASKGFEASLYGLIGVFDLVSEHVSVPADRSCSHSDCHHEQRPIVQGRDLYDAFSGRGHSRTAEERFTEKQADRHLLYGDSVCYLLVV